VALPGAVFLQPQAPASQGACTSREITRIQGAINSGDLELAKSIATRVLLCPEPLSSEAEALLERIKVRTENTRRAIEARFAIANRQPELACSLVLEIQESEPDFPQLSTLLAQTAPCSPQHQAARRAFREALDLRERGEYSRALSLLEGLRQSGASLPDFEVTLLELRELARQSEHARNLQELARAKRLVEQQQWEEAKSLLLRLKKSAPSLAGVDELMSRLPQPSPQPLGNSRSPTSFPVPPPEPAPPSPATTAPAKVVPDPRLQALERRLLLATSSFFSGAYPQVRELLEPTMLRGDENDSPAVRRALAYGSFLVGSSLACEYLLGGAKDAALRSRFEEHFRQASRFDAGFRPDWDLFSPKLRTLFQEVSP
jgi:hypothetical protein